MLECGSLLAGRYQIIAPLGAGGMGEVYRATDLRLDRLVAVKTVRQHLIRDSDALKRFEREAKTVASLAHPNIVDIHDVGSEQGVSYAVMELLQGETLRSRISRSHIHWKEASQIAASVAAGLSAAHSKGVIHRDLKPENIFLTSEGNAKILDFGLARLMPAVVKEDVTEAATQSRMTESGIVMGTLPYMSPEQLRGDAVDARTDIFSFGCILYEMISGQRPFLGVKQADITAAILKDEPQQLPASLPSQIQKIINHCLKKNPQERFHSAHDLMFALQSIGRESASSGPAISVSKRNAMIALIMLFAVAFTLLWLKRSPSVAAVGRIQSLAVLPLENLSGDPRQEYFSDGMTEELITDLAQIKALRVISRTSVMRYKKTTKSVPEIAKELKVDGVVEGSVVREGDRIRVTAQLIYAPTDTHLWAQSYERETNRVLQLQGEVAREIVDQIRIEITPQEKAQLSQKHTVNPVAHEAYLRGRFLFEQFSPENVAKSTEYFQIAIQKDPAYAPAYAALAECYARLPFITDVSPQEGFPKAKAEAAKALQIDPNLAEPHATLGFILTLYDWNWVEAEKEFEQALRLNSNSSLAYMQYGTLLSHEGKFDGSISKERKAVSLDPLSLLTHRRLDFAFIMAGHYAEAEKEIKEIIRTSPDNYLGHYDLGLLYLTEGKAAEALPEWERAFDLFGRRTTGSLSAVGDLGETYARLGNKEAAQTLLDQMAEDSKKGFVAPINFAKIYIGLGDKTKALDWLEQAFQIHDPGMASLRNSRRWDPLRNEPRFQEIIRKMNYPD